MRSIFSYWSFDFTTTGFIILLCFAYFYFVKFHLKKRAAYFFAGIFLLLLCVSSPIHFIGENYLFSVHMITHVLILLIAAPLIVAGIPQENRFRKMLFLLSKKLSEIPFLSWLAGVVVMWVWHIPYIFNQLFSMQQMPGMATHSMSFLMSFHMLTLLVGGMIFCWPVISPWREYRLAPVSGVLYLSTACVFCSLLGLLITFAPVGIYTHYIHIKDGYGYLPLIRNDWKISTAADQQIGGLIMWVPCCFIYLTAAMYLLIKWFNNKKETPVIQAINI